MEEKERAGRRGRTEMKEDVRMERRKGAVGGDVGQNIGRGLGRAKKD